MLFSLFLCLFPVVFGGNSSGIVGYNGFSGSFLLDGLDWQGWMDGLGRFFLAEYSTIYRFDFAPAGNVTRPAKATDATISKGCQSFGTYGTLAYRAPGRLFLLGVYTATLFEVDMETLDCTRINNPPNQVLAGNCYGLAVDPISKDLITGQGSTFYRITPNATKGGTANITVYGPPVGFGGGLNADGITIGADGKIYVASSGTIVVLSAINNGTAQILDHRAFVVDGVNYHPDGMGISSDGTQLLVNTNEGRLFLVDVTNETWPATTLVNINPTAQDIYGDVGQVGADGCAYFSELHQHFVYAVAPCIFSSGANHVGNDCDIDTDCTSANCTNHQCQIVPPPHKCEVNSDCTTNLCLNRTCVANFTGQACNVNKDCNTNNCNAHICRAAPPNGPCINDTDCGSQNCNQVVHKCVASDLGGTCTIDADCKPPNVCDDKKCKVPVKISVINLPLVQGPSNVYAIPSVETKASHSVQLKIAAPGQPNATGTVQIFEGSNQLGATATIPGGSNIVTVVIPAAALSLGPHNVQIIYSGDDIHFHTQYSTNLVLFFFPTAGRFAIVASVAVGKQAYFYGPAWKTNNFDVTDPAAAHFIGYHAPSTIPNDQLRCDCNQALGQVAAGTAVKGYAWLGVPMVNKTDVRDGTARGTLKFGIIKVNPDRLPLPPTSDTIAAGDAGVGNLYATFCNLDQDGGPAQKGFLK